ncbi:hypothetical protein [Bacillus vallismortis]|uniref:hypothetical protein n=1 Tax=Bacillus vallismortis TaxID=72361 RepID=UPI000C295A81|nr:hypothetical protein [Bacillus vallismortis]PJZ00032.1 hypothetical protein CPT06_13925 [Bacillus vallismortis]
MNKPIIILIITFVILTLGGLFMKHKYDENREAEAKAEEVKLFEKAKKRMTDYLEANYSNVNPINFSKDYEIDPMGGISVEGTYGEKKEHFWGLYDNSNNKIGLTRIDAEPKPGCEDKVCEY